MSEIIVFPQRLCCQCEKHATKSIDLIDAEDKSKAGKKHFCDDHVPSNVERS